MLSGLTDCEVDRENQVNLVTSHTLRVDMRAAQDDAKLHDALTSFWTLESMGIYEEDESVHNRLLESAKFREGRYEVKLPWKDHHEPLPDNYQLAKKRLNSLVHRLKSDPDKADAYDKIIKEQIRSGITESIDRASEDTPKESITHYLPHHPVVRKDKSTTKVRIVYDASAKGRGPSLNSCLKLSISHSRPPGRAAEFPIVQDCVHR